jgi:plasmid maintenance system antidote protein VapI
MSILFDQILRETPAHLQRYVDLSFELADALHAQLEAQDLSPQALAAKLEVPETEVHAWLGGTHDFSLKTLCRLSEALHFDFIAYLSA